MQASSLQDGCIVRVSQHFENVDSDYITPDIVYIVPGVVTNTVYYTTLYGQHLNYYY